MSGSEEEAVWRKQNPNGYKILESKRFSDSMIKKPDTFGRTALHRAVIQGRKEDVKSLLEVPDVEINAKDINEDNYHEINLEKFRKIIKISQK